MKAVPSYPKIYTLGSVDTGDIFTGDVHVQEKLDGSQFSFGWNEDGKLVMRSHHQALSFDNPTGMFDKAIQHCQMIVESIVSYSPDTYFYCEYMRTPKQNTLAYGRIPQNHLMLFDATDTQGWFSREQLATAAGMLGIELVPELYRGSADLALLKELLKTESFLGGPTIEGVVVKNYGVMHDHYGQVSPLMCKYVNEKFQETNKKDFHERTTKGTIEQYVMSFKSEARWQKAIQHLREQGQLLGAPQDIGPLIKEIERDVREEEEANIKDVLYKLTIGDIVRVARVGFAEFYKAMLADRVRKMVE